MRRFEPAIYAGLVFVLAWLIFVPTLGYPMVFDDEIYLVGNPIFKNAANFSAIFWDFKSVAKLAAQSALDGDISTNFLMRPLTYGTFHLNYRLGELVASGYRAVNILIHCANAFLVWWLGSLFLRGCRFSLLPQNSALRLVPALAGLLFLVHPLQLESVVYIKQRATSLCTFFYLGALVCHLEANARCSIGWRLASVFSVAASMLSKESGVTAPVMAVALDVMMFGMTPLRALLRARWLLLLLPLLPLLLMGISRAQSGGLDAMAVLNIAHTETDSSYALHYAITQPWVWLRYLGLFFWPTGLNIDPFLAPVLGLLEPRFWGSLLALLAAFGGAVFLWIRPHTRFLGQIALLGLVWFALSIAPDSSVVPLPDLMAEHRTYLPSVGVFLLGAGLLCAWPVRARWAAVFGAIVVVSLAMTSVERCGVWSSPERLWRDVCDKSPEKPRPWINLCAAYFEAGKQELAEEAILNSIKAQPTVPAFANLAVLYRTRNLPEKALQFARDGLQFRPSGYDHLLLIHIGEVCYSLRRWSEAIAAFTEVLEMHPSLLQARGMLGFCYLQTGNVVAAVETFRVGLQHHPGNPELLSALATAQSSPAPIRLRLGR